MNKDKSIDKTPLVSIVVFTYNSSKFVIETLESAKNQTYSNIELIITDDGSQDDTASLCKAWLKENQTYFKNSKLITVEKNTGVSANCNRGAKATDGEWVKMIAGDDILFENCIAINLKHALSSKKALYYSKVEIFNNSGILQNETDFFNKNSSWFGQKSKTEQKRCYLRYPVMINIPTLFVKKKVLHDLDYYDESFKLMEDQPFLFKFFLNDYDVEYINQTTIKYRSNDQSISRKKGSSRAFEENRYRAYHKYARPNLKNGMRDVIFRVYRDISFYFIFKTIDLKHPFSFLPQHFFFTVVMYLRAKTYTLLLQRFN